MRRGRKLIGSRTSDDALTRILNQSIVVAISVIPTLSYFFGMKGVRIPTLDRIRAVSGLVSLVVE